MLPRLLPLALLACAPPPVPADSPSAATPPADGPSVAVNSPVLSDTQAKPVPADSPPVPADSPPVPADSPPVPADNLPVPADNLPVPAGTPVLSDTQVQSVPADSPPVPAPPAPPAGFVDLRVVLAGACFTAGYAAADNFTGAPLPGYGAPGAWLLAEPAAALARAQAALAAEGLALQIFDAYRPRRASAAMVAWAHRSGRSDLLRDGYIARRSGHNHGHTVDLGLARPGLCEPLDMGTAWDSFDPASRTDRATGEARRNRQRLLRVMGAAGFRNYSAEWWHFSLPLAGTRARDVPYGPLDPPEPD